MYLRKQSTDPVTPQFTPWFTAAHPQSDEGAVFLGHALKHDLYVTQRGEYLARFGNNESEYGSLGDMAPPGTRYAVAKCLAKHRRIYGTDFVPNRWVEDPNPPMQYGMIVLDKDSINV